MDTKTTSGEERLRGALETVAHHLTHLRTALEVTASSDPLPAALCRSAEESVRSALEDH